MGKSQIDWCDVGWSIIAGCTNRCSYCWGRNRTSKRVGHLCKQFPTPQQVTLYGLDPAQSLCAQYWPHLHDERLGDVTPRQAPKRVFIGPYGDLYDPHIPHAWRELIWERVYECNQHRFLVLTKRPDLIPPAEMALREKHVWLGISASTRGGYRWAWKALRNWPAEAQCFVSFEPLHGPIALDLRRFTPPNYTGTLPQWIIIGAETGKDAQPCDWACVEELRAQADQHDIPVFEKDNLRKVLPPGETLRREFPEGLQV